MLILTRKNQQQINIGNDIVVKVLGISGGVVRLGIEAPNGVEVDRAEVRTAKLTNPRQEGRRHADA